MKSRSITGVAAVISAAASSACCWLPLALMGVGLSAAGFASFLERFRIVFLAAAALLLGLGFYLNYFRKEACAPGAACMAPHSRLRRVNRVLLWISAVFVAAFALFPSYVGTLVDAHTTAATRPAAETWTFRIDGMTCAGCEAAVNQSVGEVAGVLNVEASYKDASAVATIDASGPPSRTALAAAVGKAGYRLVSVTKNQHRDQPEALEGHWVTELEDEGEMIPLSMDLGRVNGRWVGVFDLLKYGVIDYPVEVRAASDSVVLYLTALAMSFAGSLREDDTLAGFATSRDQEPEPLVFRRTGSAEFPEEFLRVETAADDPTVVEILSDDASSLRARFNADRKKTRLLLLLSPT